MVDKNLFKSTWMSGVLLVGFILFMALVFPLLGPSNASLLFFGFAFFLSVALCRLMVASFKGGEYGRMLIAALLFSTVLCGVVESLVFLFMAGQIGLTVLVVFAVVGAILVVLPQLISRVAGYLITFDNIKSALGWRVDANEKLGLVFRGILSLLFLAATVFALVNVIEALSAATLGVYLTCIPAGVLFLYAFVYSMGNLLSVGYSLRQSGRVEGIQQEVVDHVGPLNVVTKTLTTGALSESSNVFKENPKNHDKTYTVETSASSSSSGSFFADLSNFFGIFKSNSSEKATDGSEKRRQMEINWISTPN